MELPDLKQLKAIIALCRKSGVASIEINGIKLVLKDQELKTRRSRAAAKPSTNVEDRTPITNDEELTEEQLLFFSTQDPVGIDKEGTGN